MNTRRVRFIHYSDYPDGVEREYEVVCDVMPGYRATRDDPGCGPEVDIVSIAPMSGLALVNCDRIRERAVETAAEQERAAYDDEQDRKYEERE